MGKNKILVLGATGMLGSMVYGYLKKNRLLNIYRSVRQKTHSKQTDIIFDAEEFLKDNQSENIFNTFDYIINCIGITKPFSKDNDPKAVELAININSLFPYKLGKIAQKNGIKVIQIATDCVYSGKKGNYIEDDHHDPVDVYGKTKSLGEVFDGSILNIRNSIIGPEEKETKLYLLDWFLGNAKRATLKGFAHHFWNGVTTLQFAKLCEKIIEKEGYFEKLLKVSHVHHFIPNEQVDKFELLNIFNRTFNKNFIIDKIDIKSETVNRTLSTKFSMLSEIYSAKQPMEKAIDELCLYIKNR